MLWVEIFLHKFLLAFFYSAIIDVDMVYSHGARVCGNSWIQDPVSDSPASTRAGYGKVRDLEGRPIVVRLNLVYDHVMEEKYGSEINKYLRNYIYAVQLTYEQQELDIAYEFVVTSIKKSSQHFGFDDDARSILIQFSKGPDIDIENADINILVFGRELWLDEPLLGLAASKSFCKQSISASLVFVGLTPTSYYTLAHELGHVLGCEHDGEGSERNCNSGAFIMAPGAGYHLVKWSSCTKACLKAYLSHSDVYRCAFNRARIANAKPISPEFDFRKTESNAKNRQLLPGHAIDVDAQCRYSTSPNVISAQTLEGDNGSEFVVCNRLECLIDRLRFSAFQAFQGSTCVVKSGEKRIVGQCMSGSCITS